MHTFLITGGTGLVGQALTAELEGLGHHVRHLSTRRTSAPHRFYWNPQEGHMDVSALAGVTCIIHLAGANVAERWTNRHKHAILNSRVQSTQTLYKAIEALPKEDRPNSLISASAVGIYPNHPDKVYSESDGSPEGFLGSVVARWEEEVDRFSALGLRVAKVRIGLVLGAEGGVLKTLLPLFRLGLGSALGNGRHWMPWIHVEDLARQFAHLAIHAELDGIWNGVGPESIQNRAFSKTLARVLRRPFFLPAVPAWVLHMVLGEMAQVGLMSTRCSAQKWVDQGFEFRHPTLEEALTDATQSRP
jgi:uncharacterized protein